MNLLEQHFLESVPTSLKEIGAELEKLNGLLSRVLPLLERTGRSSSLDGLLQDTTTHPLGDRITKSSEAALLLREDISHLDHEEFWIVLLGTEHMPLSKMMICRGDFSSAAIDYRRVAKQALNTKAFAVLAYHNHPSNNVFPSGSDIKATKKLKECLDLLSISLLDHIIIGNTRYFSFNDNKSSFYPKQQKS